MQVFWPTAPAEHPDMLRWLEPQDWPPALKSENHLSPLNPQNQETIIVLSDLSFGVICFWTIDNWDSNKEKKVYNSESDMF